VGRVEVASDPNSGINQHMGRLSRAVVASVAIAAGAVATAMADDKPPTIRDVQIEPHKLCRERSDTCQHAGGTVSWRVSEYSQVTAAIRPLGTGRGAMIVFKDKFSRGKHSKHFSVRGFPTGKYRMQLTAVDPSNNRSHPVDHNFKIVK